MVRRDVVGAFTLTVLGLLGHAQQPAPASGQDQAGQERSGYTLKMGTRLVVEDVTVLDKKGKPVTGLPRTAFHLQDENRPQTLLDFREQATMHDAQSRASTTNVHTNRTLLENTGTLVAILIDPMSIDLQDQLYLRLQALRFIDSAPAGTQMAIFRANNQGIPVLLQSTTAEKGLLRTAITASVPVMTRPIYSNFDNAISELENISDYLRPVPGNKAVLWLAGKFPLYYSPDLTAANGNDEGQMAENIQRAYRALEQARTAVYPVDVRGVLQGGLAPVHTIDTEAAAKDPSTIPKPVFSESAKVSGQYDTMDKIADATGGRAFYSTNAVAAAMNTAVQLASSSYTLSYQPTPYTANGKWHRVRITVDGPYTVHYRTGYYATETEATEPTGERSRLTANGERPGGTEPTAGSRTGMPITFSARVTSAGKQGKATVVKIRYVIPTDQLHFDTSSGKGQARFRLAVLAYNAWGDVLSNAMDVVETHYSPEQMQLAARIGTPADQTIDVANGAQYLLLAVEDLRTEKVGTVQLPLATVQAEGRPKP